MLCTLRRALNPSIRNPIRATYVDVCRFFWKRDGSRSGDGFDLLKYMKLVYLAHAFHVLLDQKSFVEQDLFEAWSFGPVLPKLYFKLRGEEHDRFVNGLNSAERELDRPVQSILCFVWERYGHLPGWQLVELTHVEGGPWDTIYRRHHRRSRIPDEVIRRHYAAVFRNALD